MALLVGIVLWVIFSFVVAIVTRQLAIIFAMRHGWTDTTMPLKYYVWFFIAYSLVVYGTPGLLILIFG